MIEYTDVTYSGGLTTVTVYYGKFHARGHAKLHPDDDYIVSVGHDLAMARAMERLGAKIRKATVRKANEICSEAL